MSSLPPKSRMARAVFLPAILGTILNPCFAYAEFQAPASLTEGQAEKAATTNSSMTSTSVLITNNIGIMQARLASLKLEPATSQNVAIINAMEAIITRLQQGYTITNYNTSTDVATLANSIEITFEKNYATTTQKFEIPSAADISEETPTATGSSGNFDPADLLTQMLQQLGLQIARQLLGGGSTPFPITTPPGVTPPAIVATNPLAKIQPMLDKLVNGTANPLANTPQCIVDNGQTPPPGTAIYDISAGKVYMPDGSVLEAHSGMGQMMDNPAYVNQRNNGPTPPNTYNLSLRETPFYGVEAIRMTPTNPGAMYGRNGMLAHTKLVRGNNGSHGCVAFANYPAFLAAYKSGQVKKLIVVAKRNDISNPQNCHPAEYDTSNPTSTVR